MSSLKRLKSAAGLNDVAALLGFKAKHLAYLIRASPEDSRYHEFEVPKRTGGTRRISAPNKKLALLQSRLATLLADCADEIDRLRNVKQHVAHGFRRKHSILTNADVHRRRSIVINIDLVDFFGSINFGRVKGFFENNVDFQLTPSTALVIAQIACHKRKLPQGAPSSPVISNLIGNILDMRMNTLARRQGYSYSRYADDLSFSTNKPSVSEALAIQSDEHPNKWMAGRELELSIGSAGFKINHKKTRVQFSRSRQDVTGIVVNKVLNTPVQYRRSLRAMVNHFCKTGEFTFKKTSGSEDMTQKGTPAQLQGMLSFAYQVERWRSQSSPCMPGANSAIEKLLKRFMFYNEFASPAIPAVVFEGKTDSIYIREAIRQSHSKFPRLAIGTGKYLKFSIKLHRETKLMKKLFNLTSGGDPLKNFIKEYSSTYLAIKGPRGRNPVIVVMDNDSGFLPVRNLLKNFYKIDLKPGDQVIPVCSNLYLLLTSPYGNADHCIEDCLPASVLNTKLGVKSFSKSNNLDTSIHYGKEWLAEKVVKPKSASIDFSGFSIILSSIDKIILMHKNQIATHGEISLNRNATQNL